MSRTANMNVADNARRPCEIASRQWKTSPTPSSTGRWGQVLQYYISPPGAETRTMRVISSVRGSYTRPDENGSEDREGQ